jgi:general secretion pathway protein D
VPKYTVNVLMLTCIGLSGCASQSQDLSSVRGNVSQPSVSQAAVLSNEVENLAPQGLPQQEAGQKFNAAVMADIRPIQWPASESYDAQLMGAELSTERSLSVAVERMSVRDFAHYVFGDVLSLNYVLDEAISTGKVGENGDITLNTAKQVSPRDLFNLAADLLSERQVDITYANETYYINRPKESGRSKKAIIGIGDRPEDVPDTLVHPIVQVVPLEFGIKINVERTLRSLTKAKITPDFDQSVVFIEGERQDILHALELIKLLDTPATRSKHVGLIKLSFVSPEDFSGDIASLLENEGIAVGITKPDKKNLVIVPLKQLGGVAVFAVSEMLLDRVRYWATVLDVPGEGSDEQYFSYTPKNARAVDLGESISALLGFSNDSADQVDASSRSTGSAPSSQRASGINSSRLKMVVDKRTNTLIFYTTGSQYRDLLPMLDKLDLLPKQVALEIVIAEVSLSDEFKYGVEWALSRGEVTLTTAGAFGVNTIGGMGLIVNGAEGPVTANFLDTNNLVNVLSKPTLIVRDGVVATINVGSSISVVGQTTQDPINGDRQTTSSEYRKTGVDVTVTPTINANGVVMLVINQSISNTVPNSSGAGGNPDIFERQISTELVARSGQTVMMAGLISETTSSSGSGTPGLSKIPFLGGLFKSSGKSTSRTELIMLITPRVIESLESWESVITDFRDGLLESSLGGSAAD